MKRFKFIIFFICFLVGICNYAVSGDDDEKELGYMLTLSKPFEDYGGEQKSAIDLWVGQFNNKGGFTKKKKKLKVFFADDEFNPTKAYLQAKKLLEESKVKSIIGPTYSASVEAISGLAEKNKVPFLVMTSDHKVVKPDSDWVFNLVPTNVSVVEAVYNHFQGLKLKNIALITENTKWGSIGREILVKQAHKYNIKIVENLVSPKGSVDFNPLLAKLRAIKPDAIFVWVNNRLYNVVATQWRESMASIPLYLNQYGTLVSRVELAEGVRIPVPPWMVAKELPENKIKAESFKFKDKFFSRYGKEPGLFAGYAWDAGRVMTKAMEDDCEEDSERIRNSLMNIRDYPGINGTITITSKSPVGLDWRDLYIAEIKKGRYKVLR